MIQRPLQEQMQELYGAARADGRVIVCSLAAALFVEGMILLLVRHQLKEAAKMTVLEALYPSESKKKGGRNYWMISFVVAAGAFLMIIPQNLYTTMDSPEFVTYMGIGNGEIRMDVRQTEDIDRTTEKLEETLAKDANVEKYVILRTKSYNAVLKDGEKCNLTVETGDHTVFPVSYIEGTAPAKEKEMAVSVANAEELGVSVGDKIKTVAGEKNTTYIICGIYSDITNGGKTAKTPAVSDDIPAIWSIAYVSLKEGSEEAEWIEQYDQSGVDVVNITEYVQKTYGQTLHQISLAGNVAMGIAAGIIFVVVTLFMRLIIERERYSISLKKAIGLTGKIIRKEYLLRGIAAAVTGTIVGVLAGNLCGESLCGLMLQFLGAYGFEFVSAWEKILIQIPVVCISVAGISVWIGILEIKHVKAYECCTGKE